MIDKPDPEDTRSPKFLIMDNTPLSLLGAIEALDWFLSQAAMYGLPIWFWKRPRVSLAEVAIRDARQEIILRAGWNLIAIA